ncbi:MAG: hypothetical protein SFU99_11935 [Saprospiraceae bacterium]|nr:hypothetical protein [Saprospiraceae bacterium]
MKYLSLLLALCLAISVPTFVSAHNFTVEPQVNVNVKTVKERTVEISLFNLQQERTSISIQSLDGETTYFKNVIKDHNGYRKRLNLKDLAFGRYLLVIEQNGKKMQQVIVLDEENGMLLSDVTK